MTHGKSSSPLPQIGANVARGALIGTAEAVPGVSGGTVALVVGLYETLITSAGHLLSGVRRAVMDLPRGRGWADARAEFAKVQFRTLIAVGAGMVAALLITARFMEHWAEEYPVQMRAAFFGMVAASLWVPFSLAARAKPLPHGRSGWSGRDIGLALLAAAIAFIVVSLPPAHIEPTPLVIFLAAAVAVSALVLPGLSGSFLLLTFGLYEPTLSAVNDRDLGYVGVFALGAVVGLISFIKLLQWLLEHKRRISLVILTGVLAGSLRALWPWQNDDRALLAPDDTVWGVIGLGAAGFAVVGVMLLFERRTQRNSVENTPDNNSENSAPQREKITT